MRRFTDRERDLILKALAVRADWCRGTAKHCATEWPRDARTYEGVPRDEYVQQMNAEAHELDTLITKVAAGHLSA